MDKVLYLIGSLRNPAIPELAKRLREEYPNVESFDDWFAAGPEADDHWKSYEQNRGRTYEEALAGYAARHVFDFDRFHLDRATHVLLVLPAGKSGHMEVMYAAYGAKNKPKTAILLDADDVRWDVMYQFVDTVLSSPNDIGEWLGEDSGRNVRRNGREQVPDGFTTRGPGSPELVPDGGWPSGLLPECFGGGSSTVVRCDTAAPSRPADALGSKQVDGSSEQDSSSSYRYGKL